MIGFRKALILIFCFCDADSIAQNEQDYLFPPKQKKDHTGFRLDEIKIFALRSPDFYFDDNIQFKGKWGGGFSVLKRINSSKSLHSDWMLGMGCYSQSHHSDNSIRQDHFSSYGDINSTTYYISIPLLYRYSIGKEKFKIYVSAGTSFNIAVYAHYTAIYYNSLCNGKPCNTEEKISGRESYTSLVYIKTDLGIGFSYMLGNHAMIYSGVDGYLPVSLAYKSKYHELPLAPKINLGFSFHR